MTILLIAVAVAFAVSMGAHYTGACMGMPRALGALSTRQALWIMAPLSLAGAALASGGVQRTVGFDLTDRPLTVAAAIIVLAVAFALTSLFNVLRVPTSTIQILVFAVAGTALAGHAGVHWSTIILLAIVWVIAPPVAAGIGYLATRVFDLVPGIRAQTEVANLSPRKADADANVGTATVPAAAPAAAASAVTAGLIAVGAAASFAMGANDVANAAGALVGSGMLIPLIAGTICGLGLAVGVLSWGRPLLRKVAFDIVTVDRPMATAAQLVQALVVLCAVSFGLFTSMNQALVGAMAGAGVARGRRTVKTASLYGILRGWAIGPAAAIAAAYLITLAATAAGVSAS